jgi:hypothetical protein
MFGIQLNGWAKEDQFLRAWVFDAPVSPATRCARSWRSGPTPWTNILHYTRQDLLAVNGVGSNSVDAIEESRRQRGLALRGEFS